MFLIDSLFWALLPCVLAEVVEAHGSPVSQPRTPVHVADNRVFSTGNGFPLQR